MKLIERLYEQLAMAQCMLAGKPFEAFKEKAVKPPETGERQTIRKRKVSVTTTTPCDMAVVPFSTVAV